MNKIIEKYPKIFQDYEGNPGRVNWEVPDGWEHIINWLCGSLQNYIDNTSFYDSINGKSTPPQIRCLQVKEKWGQLEFYNTGHDNYQEGMIIFAQYLSRNTCIKCGSMINVQMKTSGWVEPLCEKCFNN